MSQPTSGKPCLRLLHASDLHLEQPIYGLAEVPEHLRELLIDAPFQAAEQVFETALAEDVDAVLLAGDVLDVDRAGPPAIMLLLEQMARLGDRGIPVYWAGGVGRFAGPLAAERHAAGQRPRVPDRARRNAGPGAATANRSPASRAPVAGRTARSTRRGFHRDAHGLFTIGVAHGTSDSAGPRGRPRALHGAGRAAQVSDGRPRAGRRPLLRHAAGPGPAGDRPARLHAGPRRRHRTAPGRSSWRPIRSAGSSRRSRSRPPRGKSSSASGSSIGWRSYSPSIRGSTCWCDGRSRGRARW